MAISLGRLLFEEIRYTQSSARQEFILLLANPILSHDYASIFKVFATKRHLVQNSHAGEVKKAMQKEL